MAVVAWRQEAYETALQSVSELISADSGFSLRTDMQHQIDRQLEGWGVNFVLWGRYHGSPVVYKCFHPRHHGADRWNNEFASLRHFETTGCVPRVHATLDTRVIAMDCLRGRAIVDEADSGDLASEQLEALAVEAGRWTGRIIDTPLPELTTDYSIQRDYAIMPWPQPLSQAVAFYVETCRQAIPAVQNVFYEEAVSFVEQQLSVIDQHRQVIHNDDLLCFSDRGRVQGFYDFELSRLGTELMQLARAFRWCRPAGLRWTDLLAGYQMEAWRSVDQDGYHTMLAANLLHGLIRISRFGVGVQIGEATESLPTMELEAARFASHVDLAKLFPRSRPERRG